MKYIYNDCCVCQNPNKIEIDKKSYITYAEDEKGFIYGYAIDYNTGSSMSPCSKSGQHFGTLKECKSAAINNIRNLVFAEIDWYSHSIKHGTVTDNGYQGSLKQLYKLLLSLENIKEPQYIQLTLF